jgi:hypothetical protein
MHGIAGCGKTAHPVVTEGLALATESFYSLLTKEGKKEKLYYGILNVTTGGIRPLKELSLTNPKYLLLVLLGFDWVDWR